MITIQFPGIHFTNIRAVFWDKDGTLVSTAAFLSYLTNTFLAHLEVHAPGISTSLRATYGCGDSGVDPTGLMAIGSREQCKAVAVQALRSYCFTAEQAESMVNAGFAASEQSLPRKAPATPLIPGVLDLLQHLKTHSVAVGILTSDSPQNLQDFIRHYQLQPYIDFAMGSMAGQLSKPSPAFYLQACQTLGVQPQQTVMIGDAESDGTMAQAAGGAFIGVSWGWPDHELNLANSSIILEHPQEFQIAAKRC